MIDQLCETHHLIIIILVLLLALIVLGGGKSIGSLLGPFLKRIMGKGPEINLNIGGEEMANHDGIKTQHCPLTDPDKCPDHKAEHERSVKNEANIEKLFSGLSDLKKEIRDGNERILLALVAGGQIKAGDIPPRQ